jgi:hypothetical protein
VAICRLYLCIKLEETSLIHYVVIQQIFALVRYANFRDSSVGIATRYGLYGPGIESRMGGEIFRTRPDRPWCPPSHLYNGYQVCPGVKTAGGVGLTTLPPLCADCLEIWEPQPAGTLRVCPGLSLYISVLPKYSVLFASRHSFGWACLLG